MAIADPHFVVPRHAIWAQTAFASSQPVRQACCLAGRFTAEIHAAHACIHATHIIRIVILLSLAVLLVFHFMPNSLQYNHMCDSAPPASFLIQNTSPRCTLLKTLLSKCHNTCPCQAIGAETLICNQAQTCSHRSLSCLGNSGGDVHPLSQQC